MTETDAACRVYLDANIFIYALEGEPAISEPLHEMFLAARASPRSRLVTSELTLAEVLCKENQPSVTTQLYLDLLTSSGIVQLQPVSRDVLMGSAQLRRVIAPFKLADAIHVASAMQAECGLFMSMDGRLKSLPAGMRRVAADRQGLASVMKALHA
ncbi:MAG: PilT protein-like protein [Hyphomicrobiales bacterium]|jgi:predicted nucleic acid-binding protein|nr:PilT protein-like protein [Hyphomicrobiales bacterium]